MSTWPLSVLVEVEWRDSTARVGWYMPDEERAARQVGPLRSVGYLLTKDRDVVQLVQTMSGLTGAVSSTVTIPRENVVRIRRVR